MYIANPFILGSSQSDRDLKRRFLVETEDGTWRWATGKDLLDIMSAYPRFWQGMIDGWYDPERESDL